MIFGAKKNIFAIQENHSTLQWLSNSNQGQIWWSISTKDKQILTFDLCCTQEVNTIGSYSVNINSSKMAYLKNFFQIILKTIEQNSREFSKYHSTIASYLTCDILHQTTSKSIKKKLQMWGYVYLMNMATPPVPHIKRRGD